jgi:hypothetical protein
MRSVPLAESRFEYRLIHYLNLTLLHGSDSVQTN